MSCCQCTVMIFTNQPSIFPGVNGFISCNSGESYISVCRNSCCEINAIFTGKHRLFSSLKVLSCWKVSKMFHFLVILGLDTDHKKFRSSVIFSNIFRWFHIILVLHAYWGTSMMCPKGCISGTRVKVAAELVRAWGFLLTVFFLLSWQSYKQCGSVVK